MLSNILKADEAITKILGWSAEELEGHRTVEFIHPDDHALAVDNWVEMLAVPGPGRRVRLRHRRRDDSWVWFEVTNHNLTRDPDHKCVVSEMVDISEEMAAHEELRAREQLLDRLATAMPVGMFQIDAERRIVYTNDRLHQILGVERSGTVEEQLATVAEADRPVLERALEATLGRGLEADIEVQLQLSPDEAPRFSTVSLRALSSEDGTVTGAMACVADVTDSVRMREELVRRATFDELTDCYNRASIMLALEANIERSGGERAVVFVDVDCFKAVNDEHGHAVGDELLRVVARQLQAGRARDRPRGPHRRRRVPRGVSGHRRPRVGDEPRRAAVGGGAPRVDPRRQRLDRRARQRRRRVVRWRRGRRRRDRRPGRRRDVRIKAPGHRRTPARQRGLTCGRSPSASDSSAARVAARTPASTMRGRARSPRP